MIRRIYWLCIFVLFSSCSSSLFTQRKFVVTADEAAKKSIHQDKSETKTNEIKEIPPEIEPALTSIDRYNSQPKPQTKKIIDYCAELEQAAIRYQWRPLHCMNYQWHHVRNSVKGSPLIWVTYGDEEKHRKDPLNATLVMCGVHGDEITPIKFCFDLMKHLEVNREIYRDKLIVVAPVVNPDSFLKKRPTRTNHRGVDINRNFPTKDWRKDALRLWKHRYKKDKRRYPGKRPLSEPETLFSVNLIKRYDPKKIISIHAPLTLLDYDGPENSEANKMLGKMANQLLIQMSEKALGYRIKNYPYFPGSLGNWAGMERNIPTYTLELPTSDPRYSRDYWNLFKDALHLAFNEELRQTNKTTSTEKEKKDVALDENQNNL